MAKRSESDAERRLALGPADAVFSDDEVADLPEPVARYFRAAIASGTPLARAARLTMKGHIRLGPRWVPFRARELLAPSAGFVWAARAGGVIVGSDRYVDGQGLLDWRFLGLTQVAHGEGPDISRSAAGRCAGEAAWLPTSLLPRFGAGWSVVDDQHLTATVTVGEVVLTMEIELDDDGHLCRVVYERWGDPEGAGTFGAHRFGMVVTGRERFGGLTVPSAGSVGWHPGTPRWSTGEFFRYHLTSLEPVVASEERVG
jgi:hypothetical protein